MTNTISVSGISSWNWTLAEELAFATRAGLDAIGLATRKVDDDPQAMRRLAESAIRVTNVIGVSSAHPCDPRTWKAGRRQMLQAAELAHAVGAPTVVTTTGPAVGATWDEATEGLAEILTAVLPDFERLGVRLAIEHTNSFRPDVSFLFSLRDALDLAERFGIAVCCELNACWNERDLRATLLRGVARGRIAVVQVSDTSVDTRCTPDRLVPGDGDIPLPRIFGWLAEAGYDGPYDIEILGPRIEAEGYESAIKRSVDHLRHLTNVR